MRVVYRSNSLLNGWRTAKWLATCARTPANYVQCWAVCSNCPAYVQISVKRVEVIKKSRRNSLLFPLLSWESWIFVKETPDRKNPSSNAVFKTDWKSLVIVALMLNPSASFSSTASFIKVKEALFWAQLQLVVWNLLRSVDPLLT